MPYCTISLLRKPRKVTFGKILALGGTLILLGIGLYGLQRLNDALFLWRDDALSTWILAETSSFTRFGKADFLVDAGSFGGSSTYFFVHDAAKPDTTPLRVGGPYVSDGSVKMDEAVWSKDGSVIAVRVKVGQAAGKGFRRYDGSFWKDAYDFRRHEVISEGKKISERSQAISGLLAERGGSSSTTLSAPSVIGKHIKNSEAQKYDTSYDNHETSDVL